MKKIAIVALALMAIGFFMMLFGVMIGITPLYVDSTGMHRRTVQPELEEFASSYAQNATVTLSFASDDITIIRGERFGYTVTGTYSQKLNTQLTPSSLVIKQENTEEWFDFGWDGLVMFGRGSFTGPQVTVYIPADMTVILLDVSVASGDVMIESIAANEVSLQGASGDLTVLNLKADTIDLAVMSGNVLMNGIEADSIRMQGASGDITLTALTVNRSLRADLMSGDVSIAGDIRGELVLNGASGNIQIEIAGASKDYSWAINGLSSNIWVSDPHGDLPTSTRDSESAGVALANRITIDAMSGDIGLRFMR